MLAEEEEGVSQDGWVVMVGGNWGQNRAERGSSKGKERRRKAYEDLREGFIGDIRDFGAVVFGDY